MGWYGRLNWGGGRRGRWGSGSTGSRADTVAVGADDLTLQDFLAEGIPRCLAPNQAGDIFCLGAVNMVEVEGLSVEIVTTVGAANAELDPPEKLQPAVDMLAAVAAPKSTPSRFVKVVSGTIASPELFGIEAAGFTPFCVDAVPVGTLVGFCTGSNLSRIFFSHDPTYQNKQ